MGAYMKATVSPPLRMPFIRELDGVRAIAVLIVFVSHLKLGRYIPGGLGVTIFFFLSGYLITSLMRAEASRTGFISMSGFYARRTLRIFPPLFITLAFIGACVAVGLLRAQVDAISVAAQALFLSNYAKLVDADHGLPGPPLWSLAVEEHFYLVFPWVFGLILMHMPPRRAAAICAAACIPPLLFRLWQAHYPGGLELNYFLTHTRIDSILFGCVLALWQNPVLDGPAAWRPRFWQAAAAGLVVLVAAAVRNPFFGDTYKYTIQGAALFVVFSWVLHRERWTSAVLNWAPLQVIGLYSYTLYLCHVFFILLIFEHFPAVPMAAVGGAAAIFSMLYAAAMYYLVERPLGNLRKRLHRERIVDADAAPPAAVVTD